MSFRSNTAKNSARVALLVPLALTGATLAATPAADDMVSIPAGEFIMGSDKTEAEGRAVGTGTTKPWYLDEHPQHTEKLGAYSIDRYEVTNKQYQSFAGATGHRPPNQWLENGYVLSMRQTDLAKLDAARVQRLAVDVFKLDIDTRGMEKQAVLDAMTKRMTYLDNEPVTDVSWNDARDYCTWAGKRLPTEAEWEKAARGPKGNEFPWGQEWTPHMTNAGEETWDDGVAPVGSYKTDRSHYGAQDMAGNVSEWVADWYQPYPHSDYSSKDFGEKYKVVRGAAWGREGHYAMHLFQRAAYRFYLSPDASHLDLGFRCAKDAPGKVAGKPK